MKLYLSKIHLVIVTCPILLWLAVSTLAAYVVTLRPLGICPNEHEIALKEQYLKTPFLERFVANLPPAFLEWGIVCGIVLLSVLFILLLAKLINHYES